MAPDYSITVLVLLAVLIGLITAAYFSIKISQIPIDDERDGANARLINNEHTGVPAVASDDVTMPVPAIASAISEGANAFLYAEYQWMGLFMAGFGIVLLILLGTVNKDWPAAAFTTVSFFSGVLTSVICGFIGMRVAVFTNARTARQAEKGLREGQSAMPGDGHDVKALQAAPGFELAFDTAFRGGCVMGFALVSLALVVLFILIQAYSLYWTDAYGSDDKAREATKHMYEAIAGYGLGGSSVALFGRVGGGIYTKAADVGADLAGKVEAGLREDDPRNPAVIADNVGDNVGDIAGMGADLFGSFAEASCAAMVVSAQSYDLYAYRTAMAFPLVLIGSGIFVSLATSFVATHFIKVRSSNDVEASLKRQLVVSTVLMTIVTAAICLTFFPKEFNIEAWGKTDPTTQKQAVSIVKNWYIFICVMCGLWSGLLIGFITEYYTSHSYSPVREVSNACKTGAATNIIYGLALGYKSVIIPVFSLAVTIYVSYKLAGMYGIASAALGILSTLATGLAIDAYGPICDNAGGIAEMSGMSHDVRDITDALDAAGNTTAAIGKGFAIGSAALVSLALFGAFVTTAGLGTVDILQPFEFAGLIVGAMLPYWFSALTMKSVGIAALSMVEEVRRQFREVPVGANGEKDFSRFHADYSHCVRISTEASLRMMIAPGALVMLTPLIVGFLFGVHALAGVLAGALVSGVQMAISAANTGGAWDNAKKYIESGALGQGHLKGSDSHKAAVVGDTVGDPLKDTSGPSLNILIKLMAIISLVFAPAFSQIKDGLFGKI